MNSTVFNRLSKISLVCALLVVALYVGIVPKWIARTLALTTIAVPMFCGMPVIVEN